MDLLSNSAITALFMAAMWTLVRVVGYFIGKKDGSGLFKQVSNNQENLVNEINIDVKELLKMHEVYDENHTFLWYFPREVIYSIRKINNELQNIEEIRISQNILVERLSELIMSQKLLTERLGDLINKLDKSFKN